MIKILNVQNKVFWQFLSCIQQNLSYLAICRVFKFFHLFKFFVLYLAIFVDLAKLFLYRNSMKLKYNSLSDRYLLNWFFRSRSLLSRLRSGQDLEPQLTLLSFDIGLAYKVTNNMKISYYNRWHALLLTSTPDRD